MVNPPEPLSGIIIDEHVTITLHDMCQHCGVSADVIIEMVEYGIVDPIGEAQEEWNFQAAALQRLQTALRLQHDLGVNLEGVGLIIDLLEEVRVLRERVALLESR